MKKATQALMLFLLFLTMCKKEDEGFRVNGVLKDASSGTPMAGVPLTMYDLTGNAWTGDLTVQIIETQNTDGNGEFEFYDPMAHHWLYVGCTDLPTGYQRYASIEGEVYDLFLDPGNYNATYPSFSARIHHEKYEMLLYPKAHFRFDFPPLTPEQKLDTLWIKFLSTISIAGSWREEEFPLSDAQKVSWLRSTFEAVGGNRVYCSYKLRRDTLLKEGYSNTFCKAGDTTSIRLDF